MNYNVHSMARPAAKTPTKIKQQLAEILYLATSLKPAQPDPNLFFSQELI
jgi:hypothetical protein